jgi:hypothetical protein
MRMSAFGGIADIDLTPRNVRSWPKADIGPLLTWIKVKVVAHELSSITVALHEYSERPMDLRRNHLLPRVLSGIAAERIARICKTLTLYFAVETVLGHGRSAELEGKVR